MSSLSGSSSPDPLHLASSPLAAHTFTRRSVAPSSVAPNPRASPSKSFLMDTGDARIKVTVEPVMYSGMRASNSPSKRPASRTTTIPLRTGESSPTIRLRQPTPAAHVDSSGLDVNRRSLRKRKSASGSNADMSERRSSRRRSHMTETRDEYAAENDRAMDRAMFSEQSVPSSEVRRRRSLYPMRNQRYKRLSEAREDLDEALQAAIGGTSVASHDDDRDDYLMSDAVGAAAAGELTSANEDFTMITGESLASISFKANATMLDDGGNEEDDADSVQEEHLTSSPPQKIAYPDITTQADEAKTPKPETNYDALNWKPSIAKASPLEIEHMRSDHEVSVSIENGNSQHHPIVLDDNKPEPKQSSPTTHADSHHASHVTTGGAVEPMEDNEVTVGASISDDEDHNNEDREVNVDEDAQMREAEEVINIEDADDDIWAEEASRDIDDSAITSTSTRSQPSQRSRRLENQAAATTNSAPQPVSEQPQPGRRARLPRTWRQANGVDSSYADSQAQPTNATSADLSHSITTEEHVPAQNIQRTSGDEAESGRSSGVLTPPSTDDDDSRRKLGTASAGKRGFAESQVTESKAIQQEADAEFSEEDDEGDHDISGFTNPGAADTQLEAHHRFDRQYESEEEQESDEGAETPSSEASSHVSTPAESGEDTGFFWQKNLPQVYQSGKEKPVAQDKQPIDLSAVLRMDSSKVEEDEVMQRHHANVRPTPKAQPRPQLNRPLFSVQRKPAMVASRANQVSDSPGGAAGHILPSPVRRSLLRSSKMLDEDEPAQPASNRKPAPVSTVPESKAEETQITVTDDSLASKASDQQQLLSEFRATTPVAKKPAHERLAVLRDDSQSSQAGRASADVSYEETDTTFKNSWPEHSYEENLNIESPQKITVNFNDSTLSLRDDQRNQQQQQQQRSNLLAPRGPVKPLFEKPANIPPVKPTVTAAKQNFSSASPSTPLVRTYQPTQAATQQENKDIFSRLTTTFWSAVTRTQGPPPTPAPAARTTEQTISLSLRAQLRSRYGVLPNAYPWTMAHMRTLHRMLNSLESGRRDSIVPTHSPLPSHLVDIIGEGRLSATGRSYMFEQSHACVVQAFLQLLVAPSLFEAMQRGEVEWLGDAQAAHLRGEMGGREGGEVCFKTLKPKKGLITWEWVVQCLGCCVVSNVEMGMKRVGGNVKMEREGTVRDIEMSVMGDGEGDGRVREWFERDGGRVVA